MRLYTRFRDFETIGSEIENPGGNRYRSICVWNERNNRARRYLVADRECYWSDATKKEWPEDLQAVEAAISNWEATPVRSVP
jgi:hypothetical protein